MLRIEDFVRPHDGYKVFRIAQVDDVVGVTREHMDGLDLFSAYLELEHLFTPDPTLLNEPVTGNHDKEFPFTVVPVLLPFRNAGLADNDTD